MILNVDKSERGWEVTYDGIFGPECEEPAFKTKGEAVERCERLAAEIRAWNRSGLSDAPHIDAF